MIGFGAMGREMAGHIAATGDHRVLAYDIDPDAVAAAADMGIVPAGSATEVARGADVVLIMVATDDQALSVAEELATAEARDTLLAVTATLHPDTMKAIGALVAPRGYSVIDAPVVFGLYGAKEGILVSLCGGTAEDVERARPVLNCYCRAVHHLGPLGSGMIAKTVNNMLHWSACVACFEALSLAKRCGMDAQKLREVLLDCPADNGTLRRWDSTKFTWPEKDMDIALDLAQAGGLVLPLFGQVDQLVKLLTPEQVAGLLHGERTTYLGNEIAPQAPDAGPGGT
jgi:3-hydroxyisobutyrate dehydrogenase